MIASLQALRFIFALFIFAEHFPLSPEQPHLLAGAGAMGVSFFLVLSGFVMSIGYEQRVQQESFRWSDFMIKRLIRLWPLHLLCLGAWIVLAWGAWGSSAIHPLPLLGNALLLQWLPVEHIAGNSVAWCLSVLVVFYALYPFLARRSTKQLILISLLLEAILLGTSTLIAESYSYSFWYIAPYSRLQDFLLGILTYRALQHVLAQQGAERWGKLPAIGRYTLEALPILLYGIALYLVRMYNTGFTDVALFYLPSCLVIFLFALSSKCEEKSGIPDLLNQDWLIYLGKISFSFYMIHNLVILFVKRIMEWISPLHPWELRLLFSLATTLVLSVTINRFFEAPLADILGRAVQRKHK